MYRLSPFLPGSYDIFVQLRSLGAQPPIVQSGQITVNVGSEDLDAGALAVRQAATVTGRVQTSEPLSAKELSRLSITLSPLDGRPGSFGSGTRGIGGAMSEDGTFVIPNVSEGRFRIDVSGFPANVYLE